MIDLMKTVIGSVKRSLIHWMQSNMCCVIVLTMIINFKVSRAVVMVKCVKGL